ncbi:MAG: RNA polymerase, partial [Bacteroidaceae bacterium]|nr:RNA polymerase [Bacteroidaceae bacterium]
TMNMTAIEKMSADDLMNIIASLPAGYRTVFNMYAIEGYSHKEIAEIMGIQESSSRSQYIRAKLLIQKKIENLI